MLCVLISYKQGALSCGGLVKASFQAVRHIAAALPQL